jgi:PPOX class probable F420-dependent enzyme
MTVLAGKEIEEEPMVDLSEEQRALFEDKNFITVATVGKDGSPRATCVWVALDGDDVLLNSAEGRGWVANLRRNPRLALTIFDIANPYNKLSATGRVAEMTHEGAREHIDSLAKKYLGADKYPGPPDETRIKIRVELDKVHFQPPRR